MQRIYTDEHGQLTAVNEEPGRYAGDGWCLSLGGDTVLRVTQGPGGAAGLAPLGEVPPRVRIALAAVLDAQDYLQEFPGEVLDSKWESAAWETATSVETFVDNAVEALGYQDAWEVYSESIRRAVTLLRQDSYTVRPLTFRPGWDDAVETSQDGERVWLSSGRAGVALDVDKQTGDAVGYVVLDVDGMPCGQYDSLNDAADEAERLAEES